MKSSIYGAIALFCLAALPANAAVVSGLVTEGPGEFVEITDLDGISVGNNNFQSPNLFAFNEDQNIILDADLSGISAGTVVASHYVFFDPAKRMAQTGYVDFDAEILAVYTKRDDLDATDFLLQNSVEYLSGTLRGLEKRTDRAWIDEVNNFRLNIDWEASTPGDYLRVLTAQSPNGPPPAPPEDPQVVPLTPAWAFALTGMLGLGMAGRRKRATA